MTVSRITLASAAETVLRQQGSPMTVDEILTVITDQDLFEFKAKDPRSILSKALRSKSQADGSPEQQIFQCLERGRYAIAGT